MQVWRDKTFGSSGVWIWVPGLTPVIFLGLFAVATAQTYWVRDAVVAGCFFVPLSLWGMYYISQARTVLQEVALDGAQVLGKLYFGRRLWLTAADVQSISYYPMTWQIRLINLFDRNTPGIRVELHHGEVVRISAKIENFSGLVEALRVFVRNSEHIICSL